MNREPSKEQAKQMRSADADINELRVALSEARRKEKMLVDRAVDVICVIDPEAKFRFINRACERAWGYKSTELTGAPLSTVLAEHDVERVKRLIQGTTQSIDKISFETKLRCKDAQLIDVTWTGYWSISESGLFLIVHDVSQQKQLERARAEFVAMVGHDLRSPLTALMGIIDLIQSGGLDSSADTVQQVSDFTRKECTRILRLLDDMVELEQFDSPQFQLQPTRMNAADVVRVALTNVAAMAALKHISINVQLEEVICTADEDRLKQVMINLLTNAIKFSLENSVIEVSVNRVSAQVRFSVKDHGRGIPSEKLDSIFQKFEQIDHADARELHGRGLGLAICKSIVEKHHGQIGVESRLGQGSRFWFSISDACEEIPG